MTGHRARERCDLLVVGAGAAGLSAAAEGARLGLVVLVIDEQPWPGGHRWHAPHGTAGSPTVESLADAARAAGARLRLGASLWAIVPAWRAFVAPVDPTRTGDAPEIEAKTLVIATGAVEEPVALPGWTLPGVLAGRAAERLVKAHGAPLGERVAVVGEPARAADLTHALGAHGALSLRVAAAPSPAGAAIGRSPAPRAGAVAVAIEGREAVEALRLAPRRRAAAGRPVDPERWPVDTVVLAGRLAPLTEVAELCGAPLVHVEALGGFVPLCGPDLQTPLDSLFVCGSAAGVEAPGLSALQGCLAGRAAAARLLGPSRRDVHGLVEEAREALGSASRALGADAPAGGAKARALVDALWSRRA